MFPHAFCTGARVQSGPGFQRPSAIQWQRWDLCVARLIYGASLSQRIPSPCGPGGCGAWGPDSQEQSEALCGAQHSQGEQLQTSGSSSTPQPWHIPARQEALDTIHLSLFCVYKAYTVCLSAILLSFNLNPATTMIASLKAWGYTDLWPVQQQDVLQTGSHL